MRALRPATLDVQREDIRFGNLGPGLVWLEVEVHNRGECASEEAPMEVCAAPFGAFVASRPMEVLAVPSIPPGSSTVVRTAFQVRGAGKRSSLDGWDGRQFYYELRYGSQQPARISSQQPAPPKPEAASSWESWLQADSQEQSPSLPTLEECSSYLPQIQEMLASWGSLLQAGSQAQSRSLPTLEEYFPYLPQIQGMLARAIGETSWKRTRWAGHFDVNIGSAKAERRVMRAVRLEPGELNVALFAVGECEERFIFDLQGEAAGWDAGLFLHTEKLPLGSPQLLQPRSLIFLSVTPPPGTTEGLLAVGVTQQATGQRALVEFGFGVDTIPPGCFRD